MIDLQIYKHYNKITTKLNWKLFERFKRPSKESLGLNRQRALIKREEQVLLM
jgi:hypothetical protein